MDKKRPGKSKVKNTNLSVIAVDVVHDADKDVMRNVVQSNGRRAGLRLQLLSLTEVVLHQSLKVVAASTEERLEARAGSHFKCQSPQSSCC